MRQLVYNNLTLQERRFALLLADAYPESDQVRIGKAFEHAKRMYESVERNDGLPFFIHHIRVGILLIEQQEPNVDVIVAALLKDVMDHSETTVAELAAQYGETVTTLVESSIREHPYYTDAEELKRTSNSQKFAWYVSDASEDACRLKAAEIVDNMRCWRFIPEGHSSRQKFSRWCSEANGFFGDIMNRAGDGYTDMYTDIVKTYKSLPQFAPHFS